LIVGVVAVTATAALAKGDPTEAQIKKAITAQLALYESQNMQSDGERPYTADGRIATVSSISEGESDLLNLSDSPPRLMGGLYPSKLVAKDVRIGLSQDGSSAWATFNVKVELGIGDAPPTAINYRASELLVKVGTGWKIHAAAWSEGVADAKVNAVAKAGKALSPEPVIEKESGDPALLEAFDGVLAKGFDAKSAANAKLVGVGSAPKELTLGGKKLAPGFAKGWVGKVAAKGPRLALMTPSATTGAVWANVELTKTAGKATYKIPFRVFVIFDKVDGTWTPIHVHFAVAHLP
jgi:hypothetical protein